MMRSQKKAGATTLKRKERTTMKTKLTKIIMSSLAFTCALVSLVAVIAVSTCGTAGGGGDPRDCRGANRRGAEIMEFYTPPELGGGPVTRNGMHRAPVTTEGR